MVCVCYRGRGPTWFVVVSVRACGLVTVMDWDMEKLCNIGITLFDFTVHVGWPWLSEDRRGV